MGFFDKFLAPLSIIGGIFDSNRNSKREKRRNKDFRSDRDLQIELSRESAENAERLSTFEGDLFPEIFKDFIENQALPILKARLGGDRPFAFNDQIAPIRQRLREIKVTLDRGVTEEDRINLEAEKEELGAEASRLEEIGGVFDERQQLVQNLTDGEVAAGQKIQNRLSGESNLQNVFNVLSQRLNKTPTTGDNIAGEVSNINKISNASAGEPSRSIIDTLTGGGVGKASDALAKFGIGSSRDDVDFIGSGGELFDDLSERRLEQFDRSAEQQLASAKNRLSFTGELDTSFGQAKLQTLENNIKSQRDSLASEIALNRFESEKGIKEGSLQRDISRGGLINTASISDVNRANVLGNLDIQDRGLDIKNRSLDIQEFSDLIRNLITTGSNISQTERQNLSDSLGFGNLERNVGERIATEADPFLESNRALEQIINLSNIFRTGAVAAQPIGFNVKRPGASDGGDSAITDATSGFIKSLQLLNAGGGNNSTTTSPGVSNFASPLNADISSGSIQV